MGVTVRDPHGVALHLDVVFLGVHGVDVRADLTTLTLMESDTNRGRSASRGDRT